jgi:hypothetical protein
MKQQINLYQVQYRPKTRMFPAWFILQATAVFGIFRGVDRRIYIRELY